MKSRAIKLPPFGRLLSERLRFNNPPFLVVVCVGMDAWNRAKRWQESPNDCWGLVLPPGGGAFAYRWPVQGCSCVIDRHSGPSDEQCSLLAGALWLAGAESVTQVRRDTHPEEIDWYGRPAHVDAYVNCA